jgi:polyisoprenoid-binding protein YceI
VQTSANRFAVHAEASALAIRARSTVGPITFVTSAVEGWIEADVIDGAVVGGPRAALTVDLATLESGNKLYDAELLRRIDVRRYPRAEVALSSITRIGATDRYDLAGELTVHGQRRDVRGVVDVGITEDTITVTGEQVLDIRDFSVTSPTMLMLKIYPEVRVLLHLQAGRTS